MRRLVVLGFCFSLLVAGIAAAEEPAVPELLASLQPIAGFTPLAGTQEPPVYRFEVMAISVAEPHETQIAAQITLEPGQTHRLARELRDLELEGSVTMKDATHVTYRVTLKRNGLRIASSSASLALQEGR